jgi:hypothetical protein
LSGSQPPQKRQDIPRFPPRRPPRQEPFCLCWAMMSLNRDRGKFLRSKAKQALPNSAEKGSCFWQMRKSFHEVALAKRNVRARCEMFCPVATPRRRSCTLARHGSLICATSSISCGLGARLHSKATQEIGKHCLSAADDPGAGSRGHDTTEMRFIWSKQARAVGCLEFARPLIETGARPMGGDWDLRCKQCKQFSCTFSALFSMIDVQIAILECI